MWPSLSVLANYVNYAMFVLASPAPPQSPMAMQSGHHRFFDVQAHRGGRGNTVENLLPSFAWAFINGASTLELDNGITKDGYVVVWHDENITPEKCIDTEPAFPDDPEFPYVGKFVANLTLAQLKTLDCGSKRQHGYPMQLTYPGTRISTMEETFAFAECADPERQILWNVESKINAEHPNQTLGVEDFVQKQHEVFSASAYAESITYQSFDWRTLISMKRVNPSMVTSALVDDETAFMTETPWLAGLRLDAFPGPTLGEQVAQAAAAVGANILSPAARSDVSPVLDPDMEGYVTFTTKEMIDEAHELGMLVKPFTINRMTTAERILDWKVDGIITDYPDVVRRLAKHRQLSVAPKYPKYRVLKCLEEHLAKQQA